MISDLHWKKIGEDPKHGFAIPLSSLHSEKSCGIGEFNDLIPMIDFCASVGLKVIQLLPINDSGRDPSPYNAISSCALDPIYISLADLPNATDVTAFQTLNELPRVDYEQVRLQKKEWLYAYFIANFKTEDAAYKLFIEENASWLHSYALFKAHKEAYNHIHWKDWPKDSQIAPQSVDFYSYLQFLCFEQLKKVKDYAASRSILLMGDVPILISPDSADVWAEPELFDFTLEAGAPPDQYSISGQRWGFPLFKWEVMRKNQFAWWKRRLKVATIFFDIYRIDHVVGLFRMWAIQTTPTGEILTSFVPPDPALWPGQGQEILSMFLESAPLLPIAEDLGGKAEAHDTMGEVVRPMLKEFGICGMRVLRWERRWHAHKKFVPYDEYEPYTLSTVSTHDSESLSLWWKLYPQEAKDFAHFKDWEYTEDLSLEKRIEILKDSHHTTSRFHVNLLQEYLTIFPEFSHENPEDERINVPGTISPKNWTYRFKPKIEQITQHEGLINLFKSLLQKDPA